ncbi:PD-(D/E)XK motif protein [Curtobacterium herbarum]|uniref:PD-(D/E)XK motif protein n=1 Tax=Curtobacterium herbarum TaxID=150122 RepID=A0ABN1ZH94_9MICO|nr:PD-(D/E)XK motif protein [Curtobacterium herbarum]MBM7475883.1 hypothetical protein [Curtobacterium herbarum]MCS6543793.1 PD-(D/E)XK motif protein [Curtobacterium herbarum]
MVSGNAENMMRILKKPSSAAASGSFNGVRWPGRDDLFLAVDKQSRYWVLIGPSSSQIEAADAFVGAAVSVGARRGLRIRTDQTEQHGSFIAVCLMQDSVGLLSEFCYLVEVLAEIAPPGCTLKEVLAIVVRFSILFVEGQGASVESAVGLWGELWAIHNSYDPQRWIAAWHPSTRALLDFETGECAVEVKTTLHESAVHHLRQRQVETRLHDGWLLSLRIYSSSSGLSIGDLMDATVGRVDASSRSHLMDKSLRVMSGDLQALREWKFDLQDGGCRALLMTDVPRILGQQSPALRAVAFEVDLDEVLSKRGRTFTSVDEKLLER